MDKHITVHSHRTCPFRRPGKHRICACNLPGHPNCPDGDGKIPNTCDMRKHTIYVSLAE